MIRDRMTCEGDVLIYFEDGFFKIYKEGKIIAMPDCCMMFDLFVRSFPSDMEELSAGVKRRRMQLDIAMATAGVCSDATNNE